MHEGQGEPRLLYSNEAVEYVRKRYGVKTSRPTLHLLCRKGILRGMQPSGPRGWWLISKQSLDELYGKLERP
jgi:hypothetical protein